MTSEERVVNFLSELSSMMNKYGIDFDIVEGDLFVETSNGDVLVFVNKSHDGFITDDEVRKASHSFDLFEREEE